MKYFRIWNKRAKKWSKRRLLDEKGEVWDFLSHRENRWNGEVELEPQPQDVKQMGLDGDSMYVVQRNTFIKDCMGNDIFEGDIIFTDTHINNCEIKANGNNQLYLYENERLLISVHYLEIANLPDLKIVGNIFEGLKDEIIKN